MYADLGFANKTVCVVGLGGSGLAAARFLAPRVGRLVVADSREAPPNAGQLAGVAAGAELRAGAFSAATFAGCDVLVLSPGVPLATPAVAAFAGEVIGDVEVFARAIDPLAIPVIAITGSNGKTTVTSLAGHLVAACGRRVVVAGNIGLAVLDALADIEAGGELPECFVLELSSFQLETTTSLNAIAATTLNISEDHLDRYRDLLAYADSKAAVFNGGGVQVLNRDDLFVRAMARPQRRHVWFSLEDAGADYALAERDGRHWLCAGGEALLPFDAMQLVGLHNAANALAALALCEAAGLPRAGLLAGLTTFKGLAHRVEHVLTHEGVDFIDDSKGTNVGATEAALKGMTRPVVLIAGGDGKGQDFSPLAPALARIGRAVLLIGRDAPVVRQALAGLALPLIDCATLEEATWRGFELAQTGDVVLLSPAYASFDMFRGYAHRAEVFIASARELAGAPP